MAKVRTNKRQAKIIMVTGLKIGLMVMASKLWKMAIFMKVNSNKESSMGMEYMFGQTARVTRVSGKIMNFMVKVSMFGQMDENTTATGKIT